MSWLIDRRGRAFTLPLFVAVKKRNNWHRHDYTEPDDGSRPVQAGTPVFIKELQSRTFARCVRLEPSVCGWASLLLDSFARCCLVSAARRF